MSLLLDANHSDLLEAYCEKALKPLLDFEAVHGTPLLNTLRLMLDHSFRWTNVAELLFVHVNTLRYRMGKISELLDADFADESVRSNYYIVVKLYDYLHL